MAGLPVGRKRAVRSIRTRASSAAVLTVCAALALTACGSSDATPPGDSTSPDNGATMTMWARHAGVDPAKLLADAYNKTHKNQVKITVIQESAYQQKVGAAAASNGLPDILAADVVYSPNYVKQGLYQDITSKVKGLRFYKDLTPAHSEAASRDGKIYGTPLVVDSSLIIYNKDLYSKAGLDPEKAPANFDDIYKDAKAIRALGGDTYGFYFAGNSAGANAYTLFPYAAAAGTPPLQDDGTKASIDNKAFNATLDLYKRMYDEGIIPSAAKSEDGSTWPAAFEAGQIGIIPLGTFEFATLAKAPFQWGVAELPAPDGAKTSTFVGGDVVGITKTSKHFEQAWDFIAWTLGDDAQVNVIAKSGNLPSRIDLADNKYSGKDPRVVQTIKGLATGYTPASTAYGDIFNNNNGPWLKAIRDYIFNGQPDALKIAQETIQDELDQSK